jgi:hypothetical protein
MLPAIPAVAICGQVSQKHWISSYGEANSFLARLMLRQPIRHQHSRIHNDHGKHDWVSKKHRIRPSICRGDPAHIVGNNPCDGGLP